MIKIRSLFLIFVVIVLMCGSASAASLTTSDNSIYISNNGWDLPTLEADINNASIITHDGRDWYVNASLRIDANEVFYINGTYADTVYMGREAGGTTKGTGGLTNGGFALEDVTIRSYNLSSMTPIVDAGGSTFNYICEGGYGVTRNVTIYGSSYVYNRRNTDTDLSNITLVNTYGLSVATEGSQIVDFNCSSFENAGKAINLGYQKYGTPYFVANNSSIINAVITGTQGMDIRSVVNVTVENVTINYPSQWSSLQISEGSHDVRINDVYINGSGHNGIDIHGAYDLLITNVTVNNSASNSVIITTSTDTIPSWCEDKSTNITFRNIYTYNSNNGAGSGYSISANVPDTTNDIWVYDSTSDSEDKGFEIANVNGSPSLTVINHTFTNCDYGVFASGGSEGVFVYDSVIQGNTDDVYIYVDSDDGTVNMINCEADDIHLDTGTQYNMSYYLNARVLNTTGCAVEGAKLEITQTGFGLNGLSSETYTFYSESNGRFTTGCNRSNYPVLQYLNYQYGDTATYYTYNITASKSGQTDTEYDISLSNYGYSNDLTSLNGILYTFTLDVAGEGDEPAVTLEIDSFSPTDTTPSSVDGTEQTFSIDLTKTANVTWYIDSNEVQTNTSVSTASYSNSTAPVGTYNVTVIATDGVTEVNQTWIWTVEEGGISNVPTTYVVITVVPITYVISFIGASISNRRNNRRR